LKQQAAKVIYVAYILFNWN